MLLRTRQSETLGVIPCWPCRERILSVCLTWRNTCFGRNNNSHVDFGGGPFSKSLSATLWPWTSVRPLFGPYRKYGWDFPEEIPESTAGNALRAFPGSFPSRVRLGSPKPYTSRHLRLPEHFQKSLPLSTAGDASFFRIGSGEGLSELVMGFPAVLGGISDCSTAMQAL